MNDLKVTSFLIAGSTLGASVGLSLALLILSTTKPNPWQGYDSWWQDAQDAKMYECYQREPSTDKVTGCLLKHNVFI